MRVTRRFKGFLAILGVGLLAGGPALAGAPVRPRITAPDPMQTVADRIELVDWAYPDRALRMVEAAATPADRHLLDVPMLRVSGLVYADMRLDADVDGVLGNLQDRAKAGDRQALAAEHYVRAYMAYQRNQFPVASDELNAIDIATLRQPLDRFRFFTLRGNSYRRLHQSEAALPDLRAALALAEGLKDDARILHATLWMADLFADTGDFAQALAFQADARDLAVALDDEVYLVEVERCLSIIADRQDDRATERRASLAALDHARRSGSDKWLANSLVNVGDSYLSSHDFKESLKYTKQALSLIERLGGPGESVATFNEGLAYIGMGNLKLGEEKAEAAVKQTLAREDFVSARGLLRDYAGALEHAGYLMMAIEVYQRYGGLTEQLMSSVRQRAFEVSAGLNDERQQRKMELLQRDLAVEAAQVEAQHSHQQLIVATALCFAGFCALLVFTMMKVRKTNDRLRLSSERDALTGLHNRRYFNEHVLMKEGARAVSGCVLLADIDHFKRVNDTFGHPAGDAVLKAVSERLSAALRGGDKLVRWGGEEFLAVLDGVPAKQAHATIERLLQAVRHDPIHWQEESVDCTISIGYACFPMGDAGAAMSLEQAIALVDKALYEAKRRGRDRACLVDMVPAEDAGAATVLDNEGDPAMQQRTLKMIEMGVAA